MKNKELLWVKMQEKQNGFFVFDEVAANIVYDRMISEGFDS